MQFPIPKIIPSLTSDMGNYVSCAFIAPKLRSHRSARVILPGGEIRQFRHPMKAAELMLEFPGYFIADSKSVTIGRRFTALAADEELEFGNLYVMIPMRRVNAAVTTADVAIFLVVANSAPRRIASRVSPQEEDESGENGRLRLSLAPETEYKYRLSSCRSKRPGLDTIKEEPARVRRVLKVCNSKFIMLNDV